MTKYIIELEDDIKYLIINGRADNRCYTLVRPVAELEELNSDYINEHYGSLQDEAYQKGFEDGKKSVSEPDRIEVGDEVTFLPNDRRGIVTACHVPDVYAENDKYAVFCGTTVEYVLRQHITKTGKHYDIASILEAMRA